jgi:hypothetical protein
MLQTHILNIDLCDPNVLIFSDISVHVLLPPPLSHSRFQLCEGEEGGGYGAIACVCVSVCVCVCACVCVSVIVMIPRTSNFTNYLLAHSLEPSYKTLYFVSLNFASLACLQNVLLG